MNAQGLFEEISRKESYLCIGLDTDPEKIPQHLLSSADPVFEFNKQIIDATHRYCVAYKPNVAFYEAQGPRGWESLKKTIDYIPNGILTIADAKRGDIGNTAALYARTFFNYLDVDAVTVAPYMGEDSVKPFLEFRDRWVILLAHTSNPGSEDFQRKPLSGGTPLYEEVVTKGCQWGTPDQMMFVVGATKPETIAALRQKAPEYFFLVPGIGAQGGDLEAVSRNGLTRQGGLLVNASRSIIYASNGKDFALSAGKQAENLRSEMRDYLGRYV